MGTIAAIQEEIVEEFNMFEDWMEKYEYIIELGKALPIIDNNLKIEENLIKGCQSRVALVSFNIKGLHAYDIGILLDKMGVAIRTGHHCAQPIMEHYKIPGTIRISFAIYNTKQEIDLCIAAIKKAQIMLA
jgi:selenocysteine lyase/cysteine desulfurase